MPPVSAPRLTLELPEKAVAGFASLLQHGILFAVDRPVRLVPFLLSLPGFTVEYIETAVQTIFINGVAADSLERDLPAGSTLALSAAMPGLAGAIFRRQGVHGSLRSQPGKTEAADRDASGFITLKLFNSIATDRVCDLLAHGILLSGSAFHSFLVKREHLLQPPIMFFWEGQRMESPELLHRVAAQQLVQVQGRFMKEP